MALKTNLVTVTATGLLSRLNGKMGAQIRETFQPVVGFRKFLDNSD